MLNLNQLFGVEENYRRQIRPTVRHHLLPAALADAESELQYSAVKQGVVLVFFFVTFIIGKLIPDQLTAAYVFGWITFFLLFWAIVSLPKWIGPSDENVAFWFIPMFACTEAIYVAARVTGLWAFTFAFAILLGGSAVAGFATTAVWIPALLVKLNRRRHSCAADSLLVADLLSSILKVQQNRPRWTELLWRRTVARDLERMALLIEQYGRTARQIGDRQTAEWIQARSFRIATGIRSKKKWLAIPKADTLEQLEASLIGVFKHVVNADWDGLEQEEIVRLDLAARWKLVFRQVLGAAISIAVPSVLLLLLQRSPSALTSPIKDWVFSLLLLWILVVSLSTIDPLYKSRLESLKSTIDVLPFWGKRDNKSKSTASD